VEKDLVTVGVVALLAGLGLGFWLGRLKLRSADARVRDAEAEMEAYRKQVTEHFSGTARHFQELGRQYKSLYEHLAAGADTLCERSDARGEMSFMPSGLLPRDTHDVAHEAPSSRSGARPAGDEEVAAGGGTRTDAATGSAAMETRQSRETGGSAAPAGEVADATKPDDSRRETTAGNGSSGNGSSGNGSSGNGTIDGGGDKRAGTTGSAATPGAKSDASGGNGGGAGTRASESGDDDAPAEAKRSATRPPTYH